MFHLYENVAQEEEEAIDDVVSFLSERKSLVTFKVGEEKSYFLYFQFSFQRLAKHQEGGQEGILSLQVKR